MTLFVKILFGAIAFVAFFLAIFGGIGMTVGAMQQNDRKVSLGLMLVLGAITAQGIAILVLIHG